MLNLALTTDKLTLTRSSTADVDVIVAYVDDKIESAGPPRVDIFNASKQLNTFNTAATGDICTAPASTDIRNVKYISITNRHASTSNTVTPRYDANATVYQLCPACILLFGESLVMREGIWFHYDANGGVYGQALPVASDTVVGGIAIATQAEMEAASSATVAVTPGRLKYHPGVAKVVMFTTGTATPVASTPPTYNATLTDTGVGQLTVNVTTAFSSATAYCVLVNVEIISTTLTAVANVMRGYMRFGGMSAAGTFQVNCADWSATTNVIRDPISWHVVAFGDQ